MELERLLEDIEVEMQSYSIQEDGRLGGFVLSMIQCSAPGPSLLGRAAAGGRAPEPH